MTQIAWDEIAERATGRLRTSRATPEHHRCVRAVAWAHELTADAVEHGPDSGRDGGWSRGEAADAEWGGAAIAFLRWLGTP